MSLILTCRDGGSFEPHPEGIHPAVCVDVIDLGLMETHFQGKTRLVNKLKLVFESEAKTAEGKPCTVSRNFTASLHPKARLAQYIGSWRGRPVVHGEAIDLDKLLGASVTLVISHQENQLGKVYASIDGVSKPTRKVVASGTYDAAGARKQIAEWAAKQAGGQRTDGRGQMTAVGGQRTQGAAPVAAGPATPESPAAADALGDDDVPF